MAYGSWWLDDTIWAPKHTREPAGASEFGAPPGGLAILICPVTAFPDAQGASEISVERAGRGGDGSPEPRSPGAGPYPIVNAYHQRSSASASDNAAQR